MSQFTWITFAQAKSALYERLADTDFWVDDEVGRYLIEALRTWNAYTNIWNADFDFSSQVVLDQSWYDLTTLTGYPRQRTVTDIEEIILICYHLIEQAGSVGGFGFNFGFNFGLGHFISTSQFTLAQMTDALQRRRDEVIQLTACNLKEISIPATPNVRGYNFDDSVLSPIRNRFVPADTNVDPVTLWRDDDLAFEYFSPNYRQVSDRLPSAYGLITGPPQQFVVNYAPNQSGAFDVIVLKAGAALNPPVPTVLNVPDDFAWVVKWGAMSDLLGQEAEGTDNLRADYCLQRYRDGLKLMQASPWLILATLNGIPVETASVAEMDAYSIEWEINARASQAIVTAGMDFAAISPVPTSTTPGAVLTVIRNAPIPISNDDFVQVSRDTFDVILDYAQHLAAFKQGGADFFKTKELAVNFFLAATATNSRLKQLGLFRDLLLEQGQRQSETDPRFEGQKEAADSGA